MQNWIYNKLLFQQQYYALFAFSLIIPTEDLMDGLDGLFQNKGSIMQLIEIIKIGATI